MWNLQCQKDFIFLLVCLLEHFVFKNKLCFYLYQHHFHCLISGRPRQKNGNSERDKQRAELILKTYIKSVISIQLKSISFEPLQLDIFFTVFWQNADFWRGKKKKKRAANIIQPVVLWSIIWQTLCCKVFASHSQPGEQKSPTRHSCLVWGIQPGHPVLAVWFGSCSSAPDNRFLQRKVVLKQLPPLGTVSTVSILTVPRVPAIRGKCRISQRISPLIPLVDFSPPSRAVQAETAWREPTLPSKGQLWYSNSHTKRLLGGQGFSTAPGSAWAGDSKHTQHPRVCLLKGGKLLLHHTEELIAPKCCQNPPKACFIQSSCAQGQTTLENGLA